MARSTMFWTLRVHKAIASVSRSDLALIHQDPGVFSGGSELYCFLSSHITFRSADRCSSTAVFINPSVNVTSRWRWLILHTKFLSIVAHLLLCTAQILQARETLQLYVSLIQKMPKRDISYPGLNLNIQLPGHRQQIATLPCISLATNCLVHFPGHVGSFSLFVQFWLLNIEM